MGVIAGEADDGLLTLMAPDLRDGEARELAIPLPMSLPAVMLHLKVLEDAGLVTSRKEGRVRTCRIDPQKLSLAEKWVSSRRIMWEHSLDRLGALLDETETEEKK